MTRVEDMTARFAARSLLIVLAAAGAASAQTVPLALSPLSTTAAQRPMLDLSRIHAGDFTDAEAEALRTGVARTSLDQRFSQGLTASLGFLCDPHAAMRYESTTARPGADPEGKFLGAKVSLMFR